jgi:IMP cyclohydrolase
VVIGNGDHVDQILNAVEVGDDVQDVINTLGPEPDLLATPRIFAIFNNRTDSLWIGSATLDKSADQAVHLIEGPIQLDAGSGLLVTTYRGDASDPISWGEPVRVTVGRNLEEEMDEVWLGLDESYRVGLAGRRLFAEEPWLINQ